VAGEMKLGIARVPIEADLGPLEKDLEEARGKVEKSFDGVTAKLSKSMTKAGKGLTAGVTLPLVGAGVAATHFANEFNASMAEVATLIPGNTERVNELKGAVQGLAIDVGKDTEDLAGGLYQVISAFGDTADTVKVLEINARAASAGLATTEDAINLTSAVTKGYGDTSAEAVQKVSDLAFQTVVLGQTTFPELSSSIGRVVPLAAELGVSMEDLFGVMATATGVTGSAAEVSTQLRGVLQSLMAPTKDMADLIESLGYQSGEAMLEQLGLQGTIQAVVGAAESSGQPLQKYISQIEGQTLALALAGPQADTFAQKLTAMGDVAGSTDKAFAEVTEGVNKNGFALQQAQRKAEVMAQKVGDGLAPALSKAIDAASPLLDLLVAGADAFSKLDPTIQTAIVTVLALVAAIGPLLLGLGAILPALGAVGTAIGVVGPIIAGLATGPIGLLMGAVALLALAWSQNWGDIQGKTQAVVSFIGGLIGGLIENVQRALDWLGRLWNAEPPAGADAWNENAWASSASVAQSQYNWDIPGLAGGGIVTAPMLAVVGERESEAVIPLSQIGGLGGITINGPLVSLSDVHVRNDDDIAAVGDSAAAAVLDVLRYGAELARGQGGHFPVGLQART